MGTKTTRTDVIDAVSSARGMTKKDAAAVLDAALAVIRQHVENGRTVTLTGVGTFAPRHRKARTGRNPQTGAPVEIAASTVMGFRPAKPGKGRA
jgi:nucleoid DNA-binding protein